MVGSRVADAPLSVGRTEGNLNKGAAGISTAVSGRDCLSFHPFFVLKELLLNCAEATSAPILQQQSVINVTDVKHTKQ